MIPVVLAAGIYFIVKPFTKGDDGTSTQAGSEASADHGVPKVSDSSAFATQSPAQSPSAPSLSASGPGQHRYRSQVVGGLCSVTYGQSGPPKTTGTPRVVDAPAEMAARLAVYTSGGLSIVAPRGWACEGVVAVDGSESLGIFPPGSEKPSGPFEASVGQGVTAEAIPACRGCMAARACPLFPTAVKDSAGIPCAEVAPATERVGRQSASMVFFEDPPGVSGDGNPSGGPYPANGVLLYEPGVSGATCTMPEADHSLCTAVLNDFLANCPLRAK